MGTDVDFYAIIFGALAGAAAIAWMMRGRWRKQPESVAVQAQEPEGPTEAPDEKLETTRALYKISEALAWEFQNCARPDDLLGNADFQRGVELLASPKFTAADAAGYFCGDNAIIASLAGAALKRRDDGKQVRDKILTCVGSVALWPLHFGLQYLAHVTPAAEPIIGAVLARTTYYLGDRQSRLMLEDFIRNRLEQGEKPNFGQHLEGVPEDQIRYLWDYLASLDPSIGEPVQNEFQAWSEKRIDRNFLASIGTLWDTDRAQETDAIIDYPALAAAVAKAESMILARRPRSLLLVGEEGVGKSTLAMKLARRLYNRGWTIFQAGHAELIAGQTYIGQLEERVQRLLSQLRGSRRILWIVPGFHNLAYSGLHQYSPVSVLDTILPHVQRGEITLVGITNPAAIERLAQKWPNIDAAITAWRIEPLPAETSKELALAWLDRWEGKKPNHAQIVTEAWELAQQYLTNKAAPGNIFRLLTVTREHIASGRPRANRDISIDDLMFALSQLTGLPVDLLDERKGLDIEGLRRTFNERVLGQSEAVDCLVERVAMMKAGLTDPSRPCGVFLFAGPTGTGKTEMAKTLTEWLFGSTDRLLRLDMSEFQTPDDLDRILGKSDGDDRQALVNKIREQPFSVILLDEFEKAHPKVWDVFLQTFDDGRLSDRKGQTADFRHAIIILTSNLGGTIPTGVPFGFRSGDQGFDSASVIRAIEQAFRKEFINRLDRVVVFRPLTRDLMRAILEKELNGMLKRRGFRSRPWAVEWDESAIDFLLDKGFTADLGARPLRRAIERYLLSPLALTIVNHQVPAGDQFLFVTSRGDALDVQFVDPDEPGEQLWPTGATAADDGGAGTALTLRKVALSPEGTAEEVAFLHNQYEALTKAILSSEWQDAKTAELVSMQEPDFWASTERFGVLDMIERRDRIQSGLRRAGSLLSRLAPDAANLRDHYPQGLVSLLSQNLYLLDMALADIRENRPTEAFVLVMSGHFDGADPLPALGFAEEIADMYCAWSKRRRMRLRVLSAYSDAAKAEYRFLAHVEGFGAYSILAPESGLHVFERPKEGSKKLDRLRAIVKVVPHDAGSHTNERASLREWAEQILGQAIGSDIKIVRRYRKEPSPLVRDSVRGWRTGRIDQILAGDFDLIEQPLF